MFISFVLTGCWDRKDLNDLAVVQAIGIDTLKDGEICVTLQILKPAAAKSTAGAKGDEIQQSSSKGVWRLTIKGKTMFDAFKNASKQLDRKVFLSHNRVIIIGEDTATTGVKSIVDFFNRNFESRRTVDLFIAKGSARDVLNADYEQETIPAKAIERLVREAYKNSKSVKCSLQDYFSASANKTGNPFIPGIQVVTNQESGKKQLKLDCTAIFKKDKLLGWFEERETRGLLWVLGKVNCGVIIVSETSNADKASLVSLEILRSQSKVKTLIEKNKLAVYIKVNEEGDIGETMAEDIDLDKNRTIRDFEKKQARVIEQEINAALEKAQKDLGVDIFQFGEAFRRNYPKQWKVIKNRWEEEYPKVSVTMEVEAKLRRTGILINPE